MKRVLMMMMMMTMMITEILKVNVKMKNDVRSTEYSAIKAWNS